MEVLEATIEVRGEVTFTSREVGRLTDTEPYVLNTALYYALGLASGRYVDTTFEPTYIADTADVADDIYVSPAAPVTGTTPNYVTTTYNATRNEYVTVNYAAEDDPYEKQNLPSFGRRRSLGQGTTLRSYIVPRGLTAAEAVERLPGYVRLGKKRGKARLDLPVRDADVNSAPYLLGHPIGVDDTAAVPVANVATKSMKPTPLVLEGDYEGEYVSVDREDADRGPSSVELPRELVFLRRRR
jgi:CRISPR-associated protein Csc1